MTLDEGHTNQQDENIHKGKNHNCPLKSQGGTLVTRAYIKDNTYSSNIQSVY